MALGGPANHTQHMIMIHEAVILENIPSGLASKAECDSTRRLRRLRASRIVVRCSMRAEKRSTPPTSTTPTLASPDIDCANKCHRCFQALVTKMPIGHDTAI